MNLQSPSKTGMQALNNNKKISNEEMIRSIINILKEAVLETEVERGNKITV